MDSNNVRKYNFTQKLLHQIEVFDPYGSAEVTSAARAILKVIEETELKHNPVSLHGYLDYTIGEEDRLTEEEKKHLREIITDYYAPGIPGG